VKIIGISCRVIQLLPAGAERDLLTRLVGLVDDELSRLER
jgi:hypothetical protein